MDYFSFSLFQIAAIITAISIITVFIRKLFKWSKKAAKQVEWLVEDKHDHIEIMEAIQLIKAEFTTNGGTSIKDDFIEVKKALSFISAYMRVVTNTNRTPTFETNAEGHIVFVNKAYARMTGYSKHEVLGMGWVNVVQPSERDKVVKQWLNAVRGKRDFDEDINFLHADGTACSVHATANIMRDEHGNMLGHFGEVNLKEK